MGLEFNSRFGRDLGGRVLNIVRRLLVWWESADCGSYTSQRLPPTSN